MGFILISVTQGRQRVIPTFIAAVHSLYMREYWVTIKQTPIGYRYIDWSLPVDSVPYHACPCHVCS